MTDIKVVNRTQVLEAMEDIFGIDPNLIRSAHFNPGSVDLTYWPNGKKMGLVTQTYFYGGGEDDEL